MSDLLSILSGAATSLSAQRALTATASHNIDNANTPGYSRQTANLEELTPAEQVNGAFIGRGATLGTVTQARDRFLEAQIPQALGQAAYHTAQSDALQAYHGLDPEATGGLGSAISGFYSNLTALAQDPSNSGLRASFLGAARTLAQTFNRTSQQIESARSGLDAQVGDLTTQINSEATAVAQLNAQIRQARGSGAEPNDLLDLRQTHLDNLAELAGASFVPTSEGDVNVTLPGGMTIVAGSHPGTLGTVPDAANDGHLSVTLIQPDGSGPVVLAGSALGGTVGGTLSARDDALAATRKDVDDLASDLGAAVNTVHAAGAGLDGSAGLPLFTFGAGIGAAAQIGVAVTDPRQLAMAAATSPAGTPPPPGDASNADALLATASSPLATSGKDVQSTLSSIVSQFGSTSATAKAFAEQDGALKDSLTRMRDSYSGVSIDEEMINLQKAQRGYEAIAKVIQTTDEMMQTLMSLKSS
jgi:flagellar hook-associated protein 1 FlgK